MTTSDLIKQLFMSHNKNDTESFEQAAREYIDREKRKNHNIVAKELEKALYNKVVSPDSHRRFKTAMPIPRDTEKGFPLLEIQHFDKYFDSLLLSDDTKNQLERIIKEYITTSVVRNCQRWL